MSANFDWFFIFEKSAIEFFTGSADDLFPQTSTVYEKKRTCQKSETRVFLVERAKNQMRC